LLKTNKKSNIATNLSDDLRLRRSIFEKMRTFLTLLFVTWALQSGAQQFLANNNYRNERKTDNGLGVFVSLGVNATSGFIKDGEGYARSARGALSTVPMMGAFYQKGINERLSVRLSAAIGTNNYAFRYAETFDSMRSDNIPTNTKKAKNFTRAENRSGFLLTQLDFGYLLDPIKDMYVIELRAGAGLHSYTSKSEDTLRKSKVNTIAYPNGISKMDYYTTQKATYGKPNAYGTFVATAYAGIRWQNTTNSLLNHSALGLLVTIPFNADRAGFSEVQYLELAGPASYLLGSERTLMDLLSFNIRYTYSFL